MIQALVANSLFRIEKQCKREAVVETFMRVVLSRGSSKSVIARLPAPSQVAAEDLHTLIHFLAAATPPGSNYFSRALIGGIFPLELLSEVCLTRKGIRCGKLSLGYKQPERRPRGGFIQLLNLYISYGSLA